MSRSSGLGFGGVLLGFGIGWIALTYVDVSFDIVPYLLIIAGVGIVLSTVVLKQQNRQVRELTGGLIGGLFLAVIFSGVFGFTNVFPFGPSITGSGDIVTRTFDYQGFTAIDASHGFRLEVTEGNKYSISVSVDDNAVDSLEVKREGDTLQVGLEPGSYSSMNLNAKITMPALNGLELSGGANADISDFSSTRDFILVLSGGSEVTIVGSAGDLEIDASGGSQFFLSEFTVNDVNAELSGGSSGSVYVGGRLDADLSGGAHLTYYGDPELGDIETSSGSSITPK
jgi:hypothetical protein